MKCLLRSVANIIYIGNFPLKRILENTLILYLLNISIQLLRIPAEAYEQSTCAIPISGIKTQGAVPIFHIKTQICRNIEVIRVHHIGVSSR